MCYSVVRGCTKSFSIGVQLAQRLMEKYGKGIVNAYNWWMNRVSHVFQRTFNLHLLLITLPRNLQQLQNHQFMQSVYNLCALLCLWSIYFYTENIYLPISWLCFLLNLVMDSHFLWLHNGYNGSSTHEYTIDHVMVVVAAVNDIDVDSIVQPMLPEQLRMVPCTWW